MIEKPPTYNYYFDINDPSKPFTIAAICNTYSLVPENATRTKPGWYSQELIPCWDGIGWYYQFDWRAVKLWDKATGQEIQYPFVAMDTDDADKYTQLAPDHPYVYWEDGKWVRDIKAETEYNCQQLIIKRKELFSVAKEQIELYDNVILAKELMGADDIDYYKDILKAWKTYSGLLMLMKFETGDETFPAQPKTIDEELII